MSARGWEDEAGARREDEVVEERKLLVALDVKHEERVAMPLPGALWRLCEP